MPRTFRPRPNPYLESRSDKSKNARSNQKKWMYLFICLFVVLAVVAYVYNSDTTTAKPSTEKKMPTTSTMNNQSTAVQTDPEMNPQSTVLPEKSEQEADSKSTLPSPEEKTNPSTKPGTTPTTKPKPTKPAESKPNQGQPIKPPSEPTKPPESTPQNSPKPPAEEPTYSSWSSGRFYNQGDRVTYNGNNYEANQLNIGSKPSSSSAWSKV